MTDNLRTRTIIFVVFMAFSMLYLLPSLTTLPKGWWFHNKKLSYGLDIQGGAHLVYGVDVKGVVSERTERMARGLEQELKEKSAGFESVAVNGDHTGIVIKVKSLDDQKKVLAHLESDHATTLQIVNKTDSEVEARYYDAVMDTYRQQIIQQAIEVIRNRVDEFGVAEPVIATQGSDRILVQLPGVSDSAHAKELINKTAKLNFMIVDTSLSQEQVATLVQDAEKTGQFSLGKDGLTYVQYVRKLNEALKGKLPKDTIVSFEKAPNATTMEAGKTAFLLRTDGTVGGDLLEDAFVSPGEFGEPKVSFRFGSEGRRMFANLTEKNVNKNLAIVLDDVIYSAPNIRERIDGEGQISLGAGTAEEAQKEGNLIATALRAGALPAALQQLEERTVGPSLGKDSIDRGKRAGLIGLALVVVFVVFYYKVTGIVASICLSLNVLSLLALLSALGATLTLPGIAGIVLTVGMAIDANVIIFERIKELLKRGVSMKAAVRDGFQQAWSAIFDSNVTTAIAAAVLIYFGSGPVRGFGVTLIAGIFTTMVTAVFVTHYLMDVLMQTFKVKKLSI